MMWGLLRDTFSSAGFMPHGHCYLWKPGLVWLHVGSDAAIGLSYVVISATLLYLVHRVREAIPFNWMVVAFGAFIVTCGVTHFMEIWTLWNPTYWLAGEVKLLTAIASVFTATALPPIVPRVLAVLQAVEVSEQRRIALEAAHDRLMVATQQMAQSEAQTRAVMESSLDGIIIMDASGEVQDYNPAAQRMFGWRPGEIVGKDLLQAILSEDRAALARRPGGLLGKRVELIARRRDQHEFPIELSVVDVETATGTMLSAFVRDVSERKQMEAELRHAQKLEAVGRLAAGVAHEINTPIQFVGDNTRFLGESFAKFHQLLASYRALRDTVEHDAAHGELLQAVSAMEDETDADYLRQEIPRAIDESLEGIGRVSSIVSAMKRFAHPDSGEKTPIDLNEAIRTTLTVARNELKYVADIDLELAPLPPVPCFPGDFNQVLLNLLVNAAHAIGDVVGTSGGRGCITVRTRQEDGHALVMIGDTGGGIPEAIRSRVFEPFFTTKEIGKGTGQGLAIAHSIVVDKHGGEIGFTTEMGRGTTFTIRLPLEDSTPRPAVAPAH
jgi:PAS domain S-box-containing protein